MAIENFLIERGKDIIGIEAKSSLQPDKKWFAGLEGLKSAGRLKRSIVVCPGKRKFTHSSGAQVVPFEDFVRALEGM